MINPQHVLKFIDEYGYATTAELSKNFSIGESTARRVLAKLEAEGKIARFRGGGMSLTKKSSTLQMRRTQNAGIKEKIGQKASQIIPEGATVLLLGGTTVYSMCQFIKDKRLTVVTTNMLVFDELKDNPNIDLILLGGIYNSQEAELSGSISGASITQLRADYLFMGAYSFDEKHGFVVANYFNEFYHNCIAACETVCLLVDSSKYKCGGIAIAASPEMVDYLFTDSGISDTAFKEFSSKGIQVVCCDEKFGKIRK